MNTVRYEKDIEILVRTKELLQYILDKLVKAEKKDGTKYSHGKNKSIVIIKKRKKLLNTKINEQNLEEVDNLITE